MTGRAGFEQPRLSDRFGNERLGFLKEQQMTRHKIEIRQLFHILGSPKRTGLMLVLPLMILAHIDFAQAAIKFDHIQTGYNLTGAHILTRCESCHVQGVFKGTPRDCVTCHMAGNRMGATAKPAQHVPTTAPCESCHRTTGWIPASYSHAGVAPGTCMTCHNGTMSTGKPSGHVLTTSSCDTCHRTTAWSPAGFNHIGVAPGTCATCHGVTATGKPNGHVATTDSCDKCHRTTAWLPASFDHTGVVPGTCATCHNGTTAKGVGGGNPSRYPLNSGLHVSTILWPSCDSCHKSTTTFTGAYVHKSVVVPPGSCTSCHFRNSHEGSGTKSCDSSGCHTSTSNWDSGV
jgi:hypothetical protein